MTVAAAVDRVQVVAPGIGFGVDRVQVLRDGDRAGGASPASQSLGSTPAAVVAIRAAWSAEKLLSPAPPLATASTSVPSQYTRASVPSTSTSLPPDRATVTGSPVVFQTT